jgi:hypothetical protein
MGMWFGETWLFIIIMSVAWGAAVGFVSRKALRIAKSLGYVELESFFAFTIITAASIRTPIPLLSGRRSSLIGQRQVLLVGTCGMVGSDDILAAFVAGNALSWEYVFPPIYRSFTEEIGRISLSSSSQ